MSRTPRSGTVSGSAVSKVRRAIARGWYPGCGYGPSEYLRLRRRKGRQ
jgi:hypothetical protein